MDKVQMANSFTMGWCIDCTAEEEAAAYIKANVTKPVVSYIAGVTAPAGA
jgi:succinyl-CoA synthetase alpha subunit